MTIFNVLRGHRRPGATGFGRPPSQTSVFTEVKEQRLDRLVFRRFRALARRGH